MKKKKNLEVYRTNVISNNVNIFFPRMQFCFYFFITHYVKKQQLFHIKLYEKQINAFQTNLKYLSIHFAQVNHFQRRKESAFIFFHILITKFTNELSNNRECFIRKGDISHS